MNNDGFFHDRELVRRIRVSQLAVYVIVIAASIWAMILLLAGDLVGTIISATVTAAYGLCLFLFFKQKQTPARLLWLLNGFLEILSFYKIRSLNSFQLHYLIYEVFYQ